MRELSPCQACKRHVRITEAACPFCGAAFAPPLRAEGGRVRGRPGGRAALFLTGAGVVATGCVAVQPVYGVAIDAEVPPDADAGQPDAAVSDGGLSSPDAGEPMVQPVYGIAIDASLDRDAGPADGGEDDPCATPDAAAGDAGDAGDAGEAGTCDAGLSDGGDAGEEDASLVQPVYGVPVDAGDGLVQPVYGIPVDAGVHEDDELAVPVYGIALDEQE